MIHRLIHPVLRRFARASAFPTSSARVLPVAAVPVVLAVVFVATPAMAQRLAPAGGPLTGSFVGDQAPAAGRNILLIVADDIGVDKVGAYYKAAAGDATPVDLSQLPATPVLDAMAARGLRFDNAWSNPACSPSRALIQVGRHAYRTGIGYVVPYPSDSTVELQLSEVTLPEMLKSAAPVPYTTALIGKWHLGSLFSGGNQAPVVSGYDHFAGTLKNFANFYSWPYVKDGEASTQTEYATTRQVDDTLEWIGEQPGPWFCALNFNAPHAPFHAPPEHLHSVDLSGAGEPADDPVPYYNAMVEAMDTEIGRLLRQLDLTETTVLFVGDNGSTKKIIVPPYDLKKGKGTLYQGGINVPLIVAGAGVEHPGRAVSGLVSLTDLYATIGELAGVDVEEFAVNSALLLDSVSAAPYFVAPAKDSLRDLLYAERFLNNGFGPFYQYRQAARDMRYKLIRDIVLNKDELYDLRSDPLEKQNLLAPGSTLTADQLEHYQRLSTYMEATIGPVEIDTTGVGH